MNESLIKELAEIQKLRVASSLLARIKSSATFTPEVINIGVTFRTDGNGVAHADHDMKAIRALNEMLNKKGERLFPFEIVPITLPRGASGSATPPRNASLSDLDDIHLLYIPGAPTANDTQEGSSSDKNSKLYKEEAGLNVAKGGRVTEHQSRAAYELSLLGYAKTRGVPVLAVCAGSWRLLESYGGKVRTLEVSERGKHKATKGEDTWKLEHKIKLMGGKTLVKLAQAKNILLSEISNVNSTHWAVASTSPRINLPITLTSLDGVTSSFIPRLRLSGPGDPYNLLEITAEDPDTHTVEAFEALFGAPTMGIQWHPETYLPTMPGRYQGSKESREISYAIFEFMVFAAQSAKRRRDLIAEINGEEQAFNHLLHCVKLLAEENMVGAGNSYMAAKSALPVELWTARMRALNTAVDMFDDYYAELRAHRMVAAGNTFIGIQSMLRPYGIRI